MTQTLDSLSSADANRVLCSYVNLTNRIQVARISNVPSWYFERVVFPREHLMFEAPAQGTLEIYQHEPPSGIVLWDQFTCDRLQVHESNVVLETA
ncbi:MAG: DUF1830 domain-containing protein [Desertifilum sp. SIO1I2]|nr:DUF1830 domain-containing protein [Desertifilum sp. SIO1I2]